LEMPASPAAAPEGRYHYAGQTAAYASLSAEGAAVAIRRYLADGIERTLVPMWLVADYVADIRGEKAASVVWQDIRAAGAPSPTWLFSDAARKAGAQAMLYSSRSRPDLSHVVVFEPDLLRFAGPVSAFIV
jgi:RES domain-containing protein